MDDPLLFSVDNGETSRRPKKRTLAVDKLMGQLQSGSYFIHVPVVTLKAISKAKRQQLYTSTVATHVHICWDDYTIAQWLEHR